MTEPARRCHRSIQLAANAIRTVRETALDNAGITFTQWHVLEAATEASGVEPEELTRKLIEMTVVHDGVEIARSIDQLRERGLVTVTTGGWVEATAQGRALSAKVSATRAGLNSQLFDGITAADLDITNRVLGMVIEQARAVHTGQ